MQKALRTRWKAECTISLYLSPFTWCTWFKYLFTYLPDAAADTLYWICLLLLLLLSQLMHARSSHWQESRSRKISRRNDSLFSRSLEKIKFSFLFLFSIFKIFRKKFYFSSRFVRFLKPFSFYSWFSRFFRKKSLSLLDWWDSETQISFSSRFSRFLKKILFLFSIFNIFEKNTLSLLGFQDF